MASGSAKPPSQEPPRGAQNDGTEGTVGAPPRGDERFGPLAILRTRKADGRALLLFSRVEQDSTGGPT
jgi:hypothetical protein